MIKRINLNDLPVHPAAELFPMMRESEFKAMKEDIRLNGQTNDIVVWNGQLLDGRNRLRACTELGIEPSWFELDLTLDPVIWVLSQNLHRRHLTTAQRAMVAEKLARLRDGEKKSAAGIPAAPVHIDTDMSQADAARALKVSRDSVQTARQIRDNASPEVIEAVERGEMSLNAALETTKTTGADKAAREAKRKAEKAAKEAEKEAKKAEKAAAREAAAKAKEAEKAAAKAAKEKAKAAAKAAKEKAKADEKAAKEKAKADEKAAKLAKLSSHDQAKLLRNQIQQHIDRSVRLIDDLHHVKANHTARTAAVKTLQGIKLW